MLYEKVNEKIRGSRRVLVAFSGGVDSTLLLKCAVLTLGKESVIAATGVSQTYPAWQLEDAEKLASLLGVRHVKFPTKELSNPRFRENPPDRCYHCKSELYRKLIEIAREEGCDGIFDGSNLDDTSDYRPGLRALRELGIRSPLMEAGFTKDDVRTASRELGLPTWDKPSMACLSSRFPYGSEITTRDLSMVDRAEVVLRELGFRQVRVRHYDTLARIEVPGDEVDHLFTKEVREKVILELKRIGYRHVCVDLEGYRSGSMNEALATSPPRGEMARAPDYTDRSDTPNQGPRNRR